MRKVISIVLTLAMVFSMSAFVFALPASPDVYTITFEANGGEGTMEPQGFKSSTATQNLNNCAFTRSGYTFSSWNTKADGSGDTYAANAQVTPTSNLTLYAIWTVPSSGGGGGSSDSTPATTQETTATNGDVTVNMSTKDANSDEYTTPAVTAAETEEAAQTVTLNVPSTASGSDTVVEFAAKNNKTGVVVMEKQADGTYKLIKKAAVGDNGPVVRVKAGRHQYKLVDNTPSFTDITEAWMLPGAQFAGSRELMVGIYPGIFRPLEEIDAQTVATVLGRLDDKVSIAESTGKTWETAGENYANANGYKASGTMPRTEMFGQFYKFAGSPAVTQAQKDAVKAAFSDIADLSDAEVTAIAWAYAQKLTNGIGGGRFGGTLTANRAMLSTTLGRFVETLVK